MKIDPKEYIDHPRCISCRHCDEEIFDNPYDDTEVIIAQCYIDPKNRRIVSKEKHYCSAHTDFKDE